jgi:hypothetical protein
VNYADWFRRADRKLKSFKHDRMVAVLPRIRIAGAPAVILIPESEVDQPRIYIPAAGERVEPGERRPMTLRGSDRLKKHERPKVDRKSRT